MDKADIICVFLKPLLESKTAFNEYFVYNEPLAYISAFPSRTYLAADKAH